MLTNDGDVRVHGENATPRHGAQGGPLGVHGSRGGGQVLVEEAEDEEADDLGHNAGGDGQTLQDEVGNVEVGGQRKLVSQETGGGAWVVGELLGNRRGSGADGDNQEDLDDLEGEVRVLGEQLDARQSRLSRELGQDAHDDWDQGHEDGQENGWQETGNNTQNLLWDTVDPGEPRDGSQLRHVGDDTDSGDGDGPEDDQSSDESLDRVTADHLLPPRDFQGAPDDLVGVHSNVAGGHVQGLVVRQRLVGTLGGGLGAELNEDGVDGLIGTSLVGLARNLGVGDQLLELLAAPVDGVDLCAEEAEEASAVRWALLGWEPAGSNGSRLGISGSDNGLLVIGSALLEGLEALLVGELDQLGLGALEPVGSLVALLDKLVKGLGISGDPDVLDLVAKDLAELGLIEVGIGDGGEEHGAGGDAVRVDGRQEEGLAQVDVEDALAADHELDKGEEDPSDEDVGVHAVLAIGVLVQVAKGQQVKTLGAIAARRVDGEQDGPGDEAAEEADGDEDAHVAQEQVGVERLGLEHIGIGDLPEGAEPVEHASWELWGALASPEVGSRGIEATVRPTQDQEDGDIDEGDEQGRDQCRDETGDGGVLVGVGGSSICSPEEAVHDGRSGRESSLADAEWN
ncbi:hypothetical protein V502_06294 [Pseudogymnoascus sp. VKM F-4520 (FW-2644)]|nr:hypothetical protein V502_06294 [Pseudogymnoascus sp. VKM F-4520 (FW-2644)]